NIISRVDKKYSYVDDVIVTNCNYGNSTPIMNATYHFSNIKIKDMMYKNKVPIVPGFFGKTFTGQITTMGRGGSDLTATILGHCLESEDISFYKVECDKQGNWKRGLVGIVHPDEKTITDLSFNEMHELGKYGRTVLHESSMLPIINDHYIKIYIKNTFEPDKEGTLIKNKVKREIILATITTEKCNDDSTYIHLIGDNIAHKISQGVFPYAIWNKNVHSATILAKNNRCQYIINNLLRKYSSN
ncbi:uncharacterized protein METZ01_LOCUS286695, partial [marine metagenome]